MPTETKIVSPADMKILVVGDRAWGKGDTLRSALDELARSGGRRNYYKAFIVHPDSYVTDMGSISYPLDYPPKEFHKIGM